MIYLGYWGAKINKKIYVTIVFYKLVEHQNLHSLQEKIHLIICNNFQVRAILRIYYVN
jgi:hypothetical protein